MTKGAESFASPTALVDCRQAIDRTDRMNLWIVSAVNSNNNADFATFCIIETM